MSHFKENITAKLLANVLYFTLSIAEKELKSATVLDKCSVFLMPCVIAVDGFMATQSTYLAKF